MYFVELLIILLLYQIVEVFAARQPPTVHIPNQGSLMGIYLTMFRTQRIVGYLGIPYAQPPIEERRFTPPIVDVLPNWDGIRNSSELVSSCWADNRRPPKMYEDAFMKLIGAPKYNYARYDEDCLYLNIYTPEDKPQEEGYAVIVWLHSGDFTNGDPSELNPFHLVFKQKVIIVTVAYRLGIFGFLTTNDGESPGNYGLMDQSAALVWINNNINLFGGNADSITLMGHGAGAISASLHLTSGNWSMGLFDKAIIMSGNSLTELGAIRDPNMYKTTLDRLATDFGCRRQPTSDLITCLRNADAGNLLKSIPILEWGPVIDNGLSNTTLPFIPYEPLLLIEQNRYHKVPLMTGYTNMEDLLGETAVGDMLDDGISVELYDTLISDAILNELAALATNDTCGGNSQAIVDAVKFVYKPYPQVTDQMLLRQKFINFITDRSYASPTFLLASHMSKSAKTYVYRFDMKPETTVVTNSLPPWAGVPHRFDLVFVWGLPYWVSLENQTQWHSADKHVSDIIMTLWTNFAKYTNPIEKGAYVGWDQFNVTKPGALIIDRTFNMSDANTFNYQAVQFWNDYYPKLLDFTLSCCNDTYNAGRSIYHNQMLTFWLIVVVTQTIFPVSVSIILFLVCQIS